jgi:phage baseplate assembly protein W
MTAYDNQGYTYLGTAVKHPISLYIGGRPKMTANNDAVEQAILHRLNIPIGSLIFARSYGSDIHKLLFMPNNSVLHALLKQYIKEAVEKEERVVFQGCDVQPQDGICVCTIRYRHKARNEVNSLVFPFYRNGQ